MSQIKPAAPTDPSIQHLAQTLTCHAWNADKSQIAVCPNTNEVHIFSKQGAEWVLEHVLAEHDQIVTGIDWAPKSNRIVTCSQDRNAYVWTFQEGTKTWKPVLVILRLNRAATYVKWSPNEDKFAVASGAKSVSVCYFEPDSDWWVSKHIKKHKSTVLQLDWHPNNVLLLTASSDFKCRVFSAHVKGVDKSGIQLLSFGDKVPFGDAVLELDGVNGWVHSARWSPSGNKIAYCGHDSTICFADVSVNPPRSQTIKLTTLPLLDIIWLTENSVVAAGHECTPVLFSFDGSSWAFVAKLDQQKASSAKTGTTALQMFQNKVDTGSSEGRSDTILETKHQNAITCIQPFKRSGATVEDFTTSGVDGNLIFWSVKTLESAIAGLKIK